MEKKSTSQRKIEANRRNACKSTGPRTAEGKARSRLNALKHGLRSEQVVVLAGPNPENREEFEALRQGLIDDREPKGVLEEMLVDRLAVSFWRLRRAYRFEAKSIEQANTPSAVSQVLAGLSGLPNEPTEKVLPSSGDLDKLLRYESMIDRELLRTMAQLNRLQSLRKLQDQLAHPHIAPPPQADPDNAAKTPAPNEPKAEPTTAARTSSARCRRGATTVSAVGGAIPAHRNVGRGSVRWAARSVAGTAFAGRRRLWSGVTRPSIPLGLLNLDHPSSTLDFPPPMKIMSSEARRLNN